MLSDTVRLIKAAPEPRGHAFYDQFKPGDLMWEYPEEWGENRMRGMGLLCCPYDGKVWSVNHGKHALTSRGGDDDGVTLTPSFVCPEPGAQHHFFITSGKVIPC